MKNIRLLEDRVSKAIKRLRQLSGERRRLEEELRALRRQAEGLEKEAPRGEAPGDETWKAERARVVAAIRETLQELRAD